MAEIHGIEVWNSSYDGRFLPNDRSIALWQNLRSCNPTLGAFGGQDLHRVTPHTHVTTTLPISDPTLRAILHELKTANFVISTPFFRVRPSAIPEGIRLNILSSLRRGYLSAKAVRDLLPH